MKTAKKILKWTGIVTASLLACMALAVVVLERRTYDPGLPAITASNDPAVIAHGRYIVYGAGHCTACHGDPARRADFDAGKEAPLSGGHEFRLPIGIVRSPNITPDAETGIGAMSDGLLARSLRHGVRRDGQKLAPFMSFAHLSDQDLTAVISYLRAQAPVKKPVTTRQLNLLGHVVTAFVLQPVGPTRPVPATSPAGPTVERGRYLVHSVAGCADCHTKRDLRTGKFVGAPLAGGTEFNERTPVEQTFVSPNLTPHAGSGRIASWNEDIFVARLQTGKGPLGSPMPWSSYGRLNEEDMRAIYRYLRTLPPVENHTGDSVRPVQVASN